MMMELAQFFADLACGLLPITIAFVVAAALAALRDRRISEKRLPDGGRQAAESDFVQVDAMRTARETESGAERPAKVAAWRS
jgi:hypothetical protein